MSLYERIQKIMADNQMGITDFLEYSGFPRNTYYKLKKGETSTITNKLGWKIINKFTDYEFEWLMYGKQTNSEKNVNKGHEYFKKSALDIISNWEDYMAVDFFEKFIEGIVSKEVSTKYEQFIKDIYNKDD